MVKTLIHNIAMIVVSLALTSCGLPGIIADVPNAYERSFYKREPYYLVHNQVVTTPDGSILHLVGVKIRTQDLQHYQAEQDKGNVTAISGPYPPDSK